MSSYDRRQQPIGIFDSGVGGLSVMAEIAAQLPHEDVLYFADSGHCPYGPRPLAEVRKFSSAIVDFLIRQEAKLIVVACNTASAAALSPLRQQFSILIVGMEPAVKPAVEATQSGVVGVLATPATFQGELFASLLDRYAGSVTVIPQICAGLVEQVEAGRLDGPETEARLRSCLEPLLARGADALVLGCTHYPFLRPLIQRIAGDAIEVIDPSPAVARQTGRVLEREGLLNPKSESGEYRFYTNGNAHAFRGQLERLVPTQAGRGPVVPVEWVGGRPQVTVR